MMSNRSIESQRGPFEVTREDDLEMAARDGADLRADVYRPAAPGPLPVLLRRTPYGKRLNDLAADFRWSFNHLMSDRAAAACPGSPCNISGGMDLR